MIKVSIDAMGGDYGLDVTIPASLKALQYNHQLHITLVGDEKKISSHLKKFGANQHPRITLVHAPESVLMDELPSHALRNKKQSSMRIAINLVKEGKVAACVSAGNTGALMATARFVLKTIHGIDRPAIIAEMPSLYNRTRVIDLGANVDSCAEHLFQFAVMGSALIRAIEGIEQPKIAVLNVGVEEMKGNDQVKCIAQMLSNCKVMNYIGYVEGDHYFKGHADLIVCDGFVGNSALKASEGIASMMLQVLRESFSRNLLTKLAGLIAKPALSHLKKRMDPARYNGATLLGLNGIVIKSHGGASVQAFLHAIEQASIQAENQVVEKVHEQILEFIEQGLLL